MGKFFKLAVLLLALFIGPSVVSCQYYGGHYVPCQTCHKHETPPESNKELSQALLTAPASTAPAVQNSETSNPATLCADCKGTGKTWVAENGSYYGEISDTTGRPKTVYVNGYYRKDGTYVQSHYRSPPRRK